jgi:hypothetical protein
VSRFQFVADHQDTFEMKRLCQVLQVSRSAFYAWQSAADARAERAAPDERLAGQIRTVRAVDKAYGAPRVTAELNDAADRTLVQEATGLRGSVTLSPRHQGWADVGRRGEGLVTTEVRGASGTDRRGCLRRGGRAHAPAAGDRWTRRDQDSLPGVPVPRGEPSRSSASSSRARSAAPTTA